MTRQKRPLLFHATEFLCGGAAYGMIEVLWRGYTHFSMLLAGGICFWILCRLSEKSAHWLPLSIMGGLCITAVELITGCIVNLWLGWGVWDYSGRAFHAWGQVCPDFSIIWCVLSCIVILCGKAVRRIRVKG
ncbi:MAG: putative ABC transporter permease [Oscillospiraceae bacterium]|nr:putative ABC transporter permease [Oscillospiraceae bacterium]